MLIYNRWMTCYQRLSRRTCSVADTLAKSDVLEQTTDPTPPEIPRPSQTLTGEVVK